MDNQSFDLLGKLIENSPALMAILGFLTLLALSPSAVIGFLGWVLIKDFKKVLEEIRDQLASISDRINDVEKEVLKTSISRG